MKAWATRNLNEIVGLAVMALMAVALIAGQADATLQRPAHSDHARNSNYVAASLEAVAESAVFRADLEIQLDLDRLLDVATDDDSRETLRDLIWINLGRDGRATE